MTSRGGRLSFGQREEKVDEERKVSAERPQEDFIKRDERTGCTGVCVPVPRTQGWTDS
jgi:hypothetical protein